MRVFWVALGTVFFVFGLIGAVLPLMPGAVFMLLAAFCFARGSRRLHDWLVEHRWFGAAIRDWRESGAISRPAKLMAMAAIALSFAMTIAIGAPPWALGTQALVLGGVIIFILTRPEPGRNGRSG